MKDKNKDISCSKAEDRTTTEHFLFSFLLEPILKL